MTEDIRKEEQEIPPVRWLISVQGCSPELIRALDAVAAVLPTAFRPIVTGVPRPNEEISITRWTEPPPDVEDAPTTAQRLPSAKPELRAMPRLRRCKDVLRRTSWLWKSSGFYSSRWLRSCRRRPDRSGADGENRNGLPRRPKDKLH
jgi:hypothetical protein